jgi:hypothetical protein
MGRVEGQVGRRCVVEGHGGPARRGIARGGPLTLLQRSPPSVVIASRGGRAETMVGKWPTELRSRW